MATKRQVEANRLNAKRSTGPTTEAGRARSSMNALKHGLTARDVTLDEAEARKFGAFRDDIVRDLAPVGALEEELAQRIATCSWRLRRVLHLEAEIAAVAPRFLSNGSNEHLMRYEIAIDRSLQRALHELERRQARGRGEAVAAPISVDVTHSIDAQAGAVPVLSPAGSLMTREPHSNGGAATSPAPGVPK